MINGLIDETIYLEKNIQRSKLYERIGIVETLEYLDGNIKKIRR